MRPRLFLALVTTVLLLSLLACGEPSAPGASPAPKASASGGLFAGKTVTMVVPYAPGGTSDIVGRVYSRFLNKFLPGSPSMIVRNIPGGEATIGANVVYQSKPDGMTMLAVGSSVLLHQLMALQAVKYDVFKMPTVAGVASGIQFYTRPGVVKSAEDLVNAKGLVFGHTTGSVGWLFVVAKEMLGIPVDKIALAYSSSGDSRRALLSGEINIGCDSTIAYQSGVLPFVEKGEVIPLMQGGILDASGKVIKEPGMPNVPTVIEVYEKLNGKLPSGTPWEAYRVIAASRTYATNLFLPPGTPDNIVKAYWTAADRMFKDADFMKAFEPLSGKGAVFATGEAADKGLKNAFRMTPEVVKWLRETLGRYGIVAD